MKTLEKPNNDFKEMVTKDRVRILTNFSKPFADFLFQFTITDLKGTDKYGRYDYNGEFEITMGLGDDFAIFYYDGSYVECTEVSDDVNFIDNFSTDEWKYLEELIGELELDDYIDDVYDEKREKKAKKLNKENKGAIIESITYKNGDYVIKLNNGESMIVSQID